MLDKSHSLLSTNSTFKERQRQRDEERLKETDRQADRQKDRQTGNMQTERDRHRYRELCKSATPNSKAYLLFYLSVRYLIMSNNYTNLTYPA